MDAVAKLSKYRSVELVKKNNSVVTIVTDGFLKKSEHTMGFMKIVLIYFRLFINGNVYNRRWVSNYGFEKAS
jgi:hypothetical protein